MCASESISACVLNYFSPDVLRVRLCACMSRCLRVSRYVCLSIARRWRFGSCGTVRACQSVSGCDRVRVCLFINLAICVRLVSTARLPAFMLVATDRSKTRHQKSICFTCHLFIQNIVFIFKMDWDQLKC